MVSNIQMNNANVNFTSNAIKYLNNEPVVEKKSSIFTDAKDAGASVPMGVAFMSGMKSFGDRKKVLRFSDASKLKGQNAPGVIKGFQNTFSEIAAEGKNIKKLKPTELFSKNGIKATFNDFEAVNQKLNPMFYNTTGKKAGKISKFVEPLVNSKLGKAIKLPQFSNLCKRTGAGFMAVIDGAMELFTEVVPAFSKGGIGEGSKQLGKSALKVGASTAGFVVGEAGGQVVGAAIGTAICPGIGTAIGGFIGGLFGGMFASSVAGNVVKSVTGETFSETQAKKDAQSQALEISQDQNTVNELKQATLEKLAAKEQAGTLNEDDMIMAQTLASMGANTSSATNSPSFGSLTTPQGAATSNAQTQTATTVAPVDPATISIDPSIYNVPADVRQKMGI